MANEEHLKILKQGVKAWNKWREENPDIEPKLIKAELFDIHLSKADLSGADFSGAELGGAVLSEANLHGAKLSWAYLTMADLRNVDLIGANLSRSDFRKADLDGADLERANLVETKLEGANISNCRIYGISAWDLKISQETKQLNLVITKNDEPAITVDNLEVAQFLYLLLHNEKIRHVIDTITSKVVLILGRFTNERKDVLDAIRDELRKHDYLPVVFDFDKPASRDLTETISTLAHMARFIIADITDAKSIPQELQAIIPNLPSVPIQPLLLGAATEYGMFEHFRRYPWVLEICRYHNPDELIQAIPTKVIAPAEEKAKAFLEAKNK
jgi:hypothetical protein